MAIHQRSPEKAEYPPCFLLVRFWNRFPFTGAHQHNSIFFVGLMLGFLKFFLFCFILGVCFFFKVNCCGIFEGCIHFQKDCCIDIAVTEINNKAFIVT